MELNLKFNSDGLIPAIVQDYYSKRVLMMAWMNSESLAITLEEKMTCFYSRSRKQLWRKGETSGNRQHVVSVITDCDQDTLLIEVIKDGPACHLGNESCFEFPLWRDESKPEFSAGELYALLKGRREQKKEGSYTTYLFEKGEDKILKKIGEECTEVIIAAKKNDRAETIYEIADLAYHVMVLMVEKGISMEELADELASRHVVDQKTKQEYMK
ncbi:bifunctional phosphoribosyl-AMP cyclohydrolase/phosphoribosyl-ATP diphosphatase HisIE [Oscillospiraceae bacterium MB08-C2-2]|nr:bifunctional phosphoribosyl-AMP cyclohydrolase/phosphoribosyl-ATP diphosphatase HisIE [Oscillospiraceae bacterium MB08-C2-2]